MKSNYSGGAGASLAPKRGAHLKVLSWRRARARRLFQNLIGYFKGYIIYGPRRARRIRCRPVPKDARFARLKAAVVSRAAPEGF
eukprot:scaffold1272_cov250-Pinguiococcus_pyrenoidosus.AAC.8